MIINKDVDDVSVTPWAGFTWWQTSFVMLQSMIQSTLPEDSSIRVSTKGTHIHVHNLVVGIHQGQYDYGLKAFVVVEQTARVRWRLHPHMLAIYVATTVLEVPLV